jgi:oxygen-independent coproporphyrinogen III oxidase
MQHLSSSEPLHLYVHIPFCIHKCHYCDFNSHEQKAPDWQAYGKSLIAELRNWAHAPQFQGRSMNSIFFGGGTPSLAPPSLIGAIINGTNENFGLDVDAEITLEANPGTVDSNHFLGYRKAGVNRLSIGVQSLQNNELRWLERIHDSEQALNAFKIARATGFDNINLDLMYGLPEQLLPTWLQTLDQAMALKPEHLSCYQLTVEPHTRLAAHHAKKPYPLPDEELALSFFTETRRHLLDRGYHAYEVSNFSQPGKQCRHNDGYWLYHDYVGIGAGAAGKWNTTDGGIIRYGNIRTPERYMAAANSEGKALNSQEALNMHDAAAESVWLGLRRSEGIDRQAYQRRFSEDVWRRFTEQLEPYLKQGQLYVDDHTIRISEKGLPLTDAIAAGVL